MDRSTPQIKAAYLLGSLNRGGAETLVLDVFKHAAANDLGVIGIYRKGGMLENEFRKTDAPLYRLSFVKNPIFYPVILRKLLRKHSITVVHAQQPLDALLARLFSGKQTRVLLTLHGYDYVDKIAKWILSYIIKRTDANIFVSESQRSYYINKYRLNPTLQKVIPNGIAFEKFNAGSVSDISLRKELQIGNDTLLLGMIGNFNDVRDQFTICRFLKLLYWQYPDFHFVFVGKRVEGQEKRYDECVKYCTKKSIDNKVTFLGSRNDVPNILKELDAFVYATEHDTFGIAVIEAVAAGIPVFVNDWVVMKEVTANGELATLYKTKDIKSLLGSFLHFIQNRDLYKGKAQSASAIVKEKYSIENHIEELKKIFKTV